MTTADWDDPRLDGPGVTAYPTQADLDDAERYDPRPDPSEIDDDRGVEPTPGDHGDGLLDALQRAIDRDQRTYPSVVPF